MPKPSDVAAEAAVWGLIESEAKRRKDEARAWLAQHMGPDLLAVSAVANGETVGRASYVQGKVTPRVTDGYLFRDFVEQTYPDEVITTTTSYVTPAFESKLLGELTQVDGAAVDSNGHVVPGVEFVAGRSYVTVSKSKDAREKVSQMLAGGQLSLDPAPEPNRWVEDMEAGAIG